MRKKRGQNQGSVYLRGSDGRWVAQLTIHKKHTMRYFYSQIEADAWLKQALSDMGFTEKYPPPLGDPRPT